ncbi:MAG: TRAP transporter large permease subunit [Atribacterota bacterium]|nr:TRAP transporter large permease subunit [Atribacterota bacterium]MDD4895997.1 TRAP transporter large permease subunit [Atribacterota bacterium]MDD5637760.1 TRAP transporter large permease subunit [Atribacterota bacterium]
MLLVFTLFVVFLLLGMPVAFAIGISGFVFFIQQPTLPFTMPVQLILSQTQNFTLLAIPTFIFAGNLMNNTGITKRLVNFASVLVGHKPGALAHTSVVMSTMMGGVSGSAIADAAMESRILGPDMIKQGYAPGYSAGVHGFSALITISIPPSIGMVLYGSIGEVSIGRLFAGGIVPGLLMMLSLMITVSITAKRRGYLPVNKIKAPAKEMLTTFFRSIWAILFPIILLVSLRSGLLLPSEAGALAAIYACMVGIVVYRELTWERFQDAILNTILDVGMIMYLIALSGLVSYGLTWEMIPQALSQFILTLSENPVFITTIILLFLLFLGMVMDSTVIILLLTSILIPIMKAVGVDLVFFGVIMVITCAIGLLTPPVGVAMYSVCSIMDCSIQEFIKESWPFFIAVISVIIICVIFPGLITFVPNLIFG